MPTPIQRRQFLRSLALLAIAPVVAARALGSKVPQSTLLNGEVAGSANWIPQRSYEVEGIGIKVPSNRFSHWSSITNGVPEHGVPDHHYYEGDWDGTFKIEPGCSNPAWIYLHLVESAYPGRPSRVASELAQRETCEMDYQVLYDFGVWADEPIMDCETAPLNLPREGWGSPPVVTIAPRYQINTVIQTEAQRAALKGELRMRFLSWRASDPRYQRSFAIKTRQCGTKLWGMSAQQTTNPEGLE